MAETSFVSKFALSHMYLVVPSDIAVPPGPGGMYRNMNTTFQRNNERAPVYELPPIHTTIEKNISNMSTQSSPGFDSFSALLSNTQKKWFGMIVVRVTLKTCCFPFLLTCSICFCQTVSPHIFGTVKIAPLHKKGPITSPQNYRLLAINGCIYRLFANVRGQGLIDGLGSSC